MKKEEEAHISYYFCSNFTDNSTANFKVTSGLISQT